MWKRFGLIFGAAYLLLFLTAARVDAWPNLPPNEATISGPGLQDNVKITAPEVLQILRLGGLEDMSEGVIPKPVVLGEGYKIIRYFEGGDFRFADLTYYPNATATRSVVYWEDGPQFQGDHSRYHKQWLYATAQGDAVMQKYLTGLGVKLPTAAAPVPATPSRSDTNTFLLGGIAALLGVIGIASVFVIRARQR